MERRMNKQGIEHFMMLFRFVVVVFLVVLVLGGLVYVFGILNDTFIDIGVQSEGQMGGANLSYAAENTFGRVNSSLQALRLVAICIIFSEILLVFVFNAFQRTHPALFIVWMFLTFLAVMLAAPVSNAYESLLQGGIYGGTLESFTGSNFIVLNLPWIVLLVGVIGGIFMFINIMRSGNETAL